MRPDVSASSSSAHRESPHVRNFDSDNKSMSEEDGTPKLIGKGDNSSVDSCSSLASDDKIDTITVEPV